jgi:hypothetical protein
VKPGTRALGVAESYVGTDDADAPRDVSTLCGAVVRADRVVDGVTFGTCRVGGTDATDAVARLVADAGREDARYLLLSGVAPAWYNLLDLPRLSDQAAVDRPVIAVSYEASPGLEPALRAAFDGDALARRLAVYETLPPRRRVRLPDGDAAADSGSGTDRALWVRSVGCSADEAAEVVRAFTPEGSDRPEPLRVARLVARGADAFRRTALGTT